MAEKQKQSPVTPEQRPKQEKPKAKNGNGLSKNQFSPTYILRTRQQLVIAVGVGVVMVGIILAGIMPQIQGIIETQDKLTQQKRSSDQLQRKISALNQVETFDIVQQADQINATLPASKPLLELLAGLSQQATQNSVAISDVQTRPGDISTQSAETTAPSARTGTRASTSRSTSATGTAKTYEELHLTMMVEGELQNINSFLSQIEKMAPLTNVTQLSLSEARGRNASTNTFTAEVSIVSYYYTQSVKQAITAPLPQLTDSATQALQEIDDFTYINAQLPDVVQGGGSINPFKTE